MNRMHNKVGRKITRWHNLRACPPQCISRNVTIRSTMLVFKTTLRNCNPGVQYR